MTDNSFFLSHYNGLLRSKDLMQQNNKDNLITTDRNLSLICVAQFGKIFLRILRNYLEQRTVIRDFFHLKPIFCSLF